VLFPAVAVDAPGADWRNAIRDTRKHIWFVLAVTILPFVPIGLLGSMVIPLFRPWAGSLIGLIVGILWIGAMLLVALTLGAVIASRLYQVIGDRLNTPLR
jgi:polyferredoxin